LNFEYLTIIGGTVKVTVDKTENRQAYLTIEMEQIEVDEGLKKAYSHLVQKYNIPGFRKGKAPRPILEQYLGKEAFMEEAVEHMAPQAFEKACKEKDIHAIARPQIELEKMEPVIYKMTVPLEPLVKLGDYKSIRVAMEPVEVKDEDIEKTIEQIRKQHAIFDSVDRQVNSHDMLLLDIESHIGEQQYINQKEAEYEVEKGSEFPMKGFSEALIGSKKGDIKEFNLSFPTDYGRAELAGKEAAFKVTVKDVKEQKLPELNDELAAKVSPEFKTVADMRAKVVESLKNNAEDISKKKFQQKVIDEAVKISEVEYPVIMEEEEIDNLVGQQMQRWQMDAKGLDEYLASIKKTAAELREEFRPGAIRSLKQSLILTEIARGEDIKIEKEDIDAEIEGMTKELPSDRRQQLMQLLTVPQNQLNVASSVASRKTLERLLEIAQSPSVTEVKTDAEAKKPQA
jgi:trigger factor